MPYKAIGNKVFVKRGGRWRLKARASSPASAKRTINLLRGIKHGWKK